MRGTPELDHSSCLLEGSRGRDRLRVSLGIRTPAPNFTFFLVPLRLDAGSTEHPSSCLGWAQVESGPLSMGGPVHLCLETGVGGLAVIFAPALCCSTEARVANPGVPCLSLLSPSLPTSG